MTLVAAVNFIGPDGTLTRAGEPLPPNFSGLEPELTNSLIASGGVMEQEEFLQLIADLRDAGFFNDLQDAGYFDQFDNSQEEPEA